MVGTSIDSHLVYIAEGVCTVTYLHGKKKLTCPLLWHKCTSKCDIVLWLHHILCDPDLFVSTVVSARYQFALCANSYNAL